MMSELMRFVPRAELRAAENLKAFIQVCRNELTIFGAVKWEADTWDVTRSMRPRSGHGHERLTVRFLALDGSPFRAPFADFARAYLRYSYGWRPAIGMKVRLYILRHLEAVLTTTIGKADVTRVSAAILNETALRFRQGYRPASAYSYGQELELLGRFVVEHRLVVAPFRWKNPIAAYRSHLNRLGPDAAEARRSKLPAATALDTLPKCFRLAREPVDVIVAATTAILCAAPDRIGEVFSLPADCEVEATYGARIRYGLRWWPEKGAEPLVKWIPAVMIDVVKEAVAKLRSVTEPARQVARWYEENPGRLFLASNLQHLRGREMLGSTEIADILGVGPKRARKWCRDNGVYVETDAGGERLSRIRFADLERAIVAALPPSFPVLDRRTDLRFSEALMVTRRREMDSRPGISPCLIDAVSYDQIRMNLSPVTGKTSLFSRLGFTEADGSPIRLATHQLRHWLNTLAQRGGMSQIDIAKWSGRGSIAQNEAYDHMTAEELMRMAREAAENDITLFGPLAEVVLNAPVSRQEFMKAQFPVVHATSLGFCVHDFATMPCVLHRDCINCAEHVCLKGDSSKTERIRSQLEIAEPQLAGAEAAVTARLRGADRWVEHQRTTVARLRVLVSLLDDPTIPPGSIVRLAPPPGPIMATEDVPYIGLAAPRNVPARAAGAASGSA